jgi:hypothetical protein
VADELDELLEQAAGVFLRVGKQYRDALLETGRLLHEYILRGLVRGEALDHRGRQREGLLRKGLIQKAAARLGISPTRVVFLVWAAMAVDLLGGGEAGPLPHGSIIRLGAFVERCRGVTSKDADKPGAPPYSDAERWRVRPGYEESGPALFRRAVAENFDQATARREAGRLFRKNCGRPLGSKKTGPPRGNGHKRGTPASGQRVALAALKARAAVGSPADVAELLWEVIRDAPDPLAVVNRLRVLAMAPRKSERDLLYETA